MTYRKAKFISRMIGSCLKYKFFKKRFPLSMSVSPTSRCNLRCKYCYTDPNREGSEYDIKELIRIVDELVFLGCQAFLIQGGEPLLYDEIRTLIHHIKSKGCFCSMSTNGTLIDRNIDGIKCLDRVQVSLDGLPEINDVVRDKGVFNKVVANLRLLRDNDIPFEIHSIINKGATAENCIKPMAIIAKEYGTAVSFSMPGDTGSEANDLLKASLLNRDEYLPMVQEIIKLKKEGYAISNPFYFLEHILKWPLALQKLGTKVNLPSSFKYTKCIYGHLLGWLYTKGEMYPCPRTFYRADFRETIYGKGGIKGAWERWAKKVDCVTCSCMTDVVYMFNLKPVAIKQALFHLS